MSSIDLIIAGLAAVAGGFVNAFAGGGTLITFPMLTAPGVPPVAANVTNTVALCRGYLGATVAQIKDLRGQGQRLWLLMPTGMLAGIAGGILLLNTSDHTFRILVPYLIAFRLIAVLSGSLAQLGHGPRQTDGRKDLTRGMVDRAGDPCSCLRGLFRRRCKRNGVGGHWARA